MPFADPTKKAEWNHLNRSRLAKQRHAHYMATRPYYLRLHRLWYEKNKSREIQRSIAYIKAHPEVRRKALRNYYQRHKREEFDRKNRWRRANPEKTRTWRNRWEHANRDKVRIYKRRSAARHPETSRRAVERFKNGDKYVRKLLSKNSRISPAEWPVELVENWKLFLQLKRLCQVKTSKN